MTPAAPPPPPTLADLMMAAGGVALENPTDAAACYPALWQTREAAKKAMERCGTFEARLGTTRNKRYLITVCPQLLENVPYLRAGAGYVGLHRLLQGAQLSAGSFPRLWKGIGRGCHRPLFAHLQFRDSFDPNNGLCLLWPRVFLAHDQFQARRRIVHDKPQAGGMRL